MKNIFISPKTAARKLGIGCMLLLLAVTIGAATFGSQRAAAVPLSAPVNIVAAANCDKKFFGLVPWYHYIKDELGVPKHGDLPRDDCGVRCFNFFQQADKNICGRRESDIPAVLLAVVDDLLRVAGLVAVAFILKGSFEYVGSRGNAEKTAAAQSTIIAALTGLAIALVAVGLVSFLGRQLGS